MRYSVARSHLKTSMATDSKAPAAAPAAKVAAPKPVTEEVEAVTEEPAPVVERVNMAGLVLEKTLHPDGECETEVLSEPEIDPALIRATRASQRARGH